MKFGKKVTFNQLVFIIEQVELDRRRRKRRAASALRKALLSRKGRHAHA
jgi:hypothetical protein